MPDKKKINKLVNIKMMKNKFVFYFDFISAETSLESRESGLVKVESGAMKMKMNIS